VIIRRCSSIAFDLPFLALPFLEITSSFPELPSFFLLEAARIPFIMIYGREIRRKEEMMVNKLPKLPIGIQAFEKLRRGGYLYVDKTRYLVDLIGNGTVRWGNPRLLRRIFIRRAYASL
jgi:hypothetical protein